jgi:hypothetical protein
MSHSRNSLNSFKIGLMNQTEMTGIDKIASRTVLQNNRWLYKHGDAARH